MATNATTTDETVTDSAANDYNAAATTRRETASLLEIEAEIVADGDALELPLAGLVEQHAPRARCTAPSCFSTERIGYVETEGDGKPRAMCGPCRERHEVGR